MRKGVTECRGPIMRKFIRDLFRGFFVVALIFVWMFFVSLQVQGGGYAYQVQHGRLKWCIVVCIPGHESYYDHYTNTVASHFRMARRLRISPWMDAGPPETTLDNP